jgi:Uma2 family endonuclease
MVLAQRMTEAEYRELILHDDFVTWELRDGVPREKPLMTIRHGDVTMSLSAWLFNQLDRQAFHVRNNHAKARINPRNYFIPDVAVIPTASFGPDWADPRTPDAYADPLPLVVEIWSPTTGDYDVATKLQGYKERGDEEIWYVHPYERTVTVWRRQPDGSYAESVVAAGLLTPASLPGVVIDLDALFTP